jgi:hypothetical protein
MNEIRRPVHIVENVSPSGVLEGLSSLAGELKPHSQSVQITVREQWCDVVFSGVERDVLARAFDRDRRDVASLGSMDYGKAHQAREGLARCLLNAAHGKRAAAKEGEELYALFGMAAPDSARLHQELRRRATAFTCATGTLPGGASLSLVHVRDDAARFSVHRGGKAGDLLGACEPLLAVPSRIGLFFLPHDLLPNGRSFAAFVEICEKAPWLMGLKGRRSGERRLAVGREPSGGVFVLPLDGIAFHESFEYRSPLGAGTEVRFLELEQTGESHQRLADAIAGAEPRFGYELELREGLELPGPGAAFRIDRLKRERTEIDRELLRVQRSASSMRILMRFSHRQTPSLAKALLSLSPLYLKKPEPGGAPLETEVRYAFEAYEGESVDGTSGSLLGCHYLLINHPSSVLERPVFDWTLAQKGGGEPIVFETDPIWTPIYSGAASKGGVFVPRGTALYPVLHSWDRAGMKDYLRGVLRHWLKQRQPELEDEAIERRVPGFPLIVCVGSRPRGGPLRLEVLDEEKFCRLETKLDWINRNIELAESYQTLHGAEDGEALYDRVLQLAESYKDAAVRREIGASVEESKEAFEARAEDFVRHAAEELAAVRQAMGEQYRVAARDLETQAAELQRMHGQIASIAEAVTQLAQGLRTVKLVLSTLKTDARRVRALAVKQEEQIVSCIDRGEQAYRSAREALDELRKLIRSVNGMQVWKW